MEERLGEGALPAELTAGRTAAAEVGAEEEVGAQAEVEVAVGARVEVGPGAGGVVAGGGGFQTPRAPPSAAMGAAPPSASRSVRARCEGDRAGSGSSAAHATQVATV